MRSFEDIPWFKPTHHHLSTVRGWGIRLDVRIHPINQQWPASVMADHSQAMRTPSKVSSRPPDASPEPLYTLAQSGHARCLPQMPPSGAGQGSKLQFQLTPQPACHYPSSTCMHHDNMAKFGLQTSQNHLYQRHGAHSVQSLLGSRDGSTRSRWSCRDQESVCGHQESIWSCRLSSRSILQGNLVSTFCWVLTLSRGSGEHGGACAELILA